MMKLLTAERAAWGSLLIGIRRGLGTAVLILAATQWAGAHGSLGKEPGRPFPVMRRELSGGHPQKPSVAPTWTIPVEPLGFSPPGAIYLGQRNSLVSLDFIDENRLLFTFRVPGLIHRDLKPGESAESDERQIRALVLTLPDGNVEAEGLWTVHDRTRYLWMLKDGHFLLRDRNSLQQGDVHLELKPLLEFPGPLLWLELDPSEQFLVSNSLEPVAAADKAGEVGSPATASATITQDTQSSSSDSGEDSSSEDSQTPPDRVVRILRIPSGQVLLVSRVRTTIHLPINGEGYLESLRGRGEEWVLNLSFFTGGSKILGSVRSTCAPTNNFLSPEEVLVMGCDGSGAEKLVAMTTDGKTLWDDLNPETAIWPVLFRSANGLRIGHETLAATHAVNAYSPLGSDDIKGQLVRVLDAATGKEVFEAPASPIFDAGGNAAISPSGRRVAVLNAGSIQVFELPAPPALQDAARKETGR